MKIINKITKIIALASAAVMISASVCAHAAQNTETVINLQIDNPRMTVNGIPEEIDPGRGTVPVIVDGRTLVPIRAIIETLGGTVGWDGEKSEVTLSYKEDVIKLVIGSPSAFLNGSESILDVAPTTINDRTMLPIRYIAESFNFEVGWDEKTSTVTITKNAQDEQQSTEEEENFDVFTDPENMMDDEYEEITEINPEDEEIEIPTEEENTENVE